MQNAGQFFDIRSNNVRFFLHRIPRFRMSLSSSCSAILEDLLKDARRCHFVLIRCFTGKTTWQISRGWFLASLRESTQENISGMHFKVQDSENTTAMKIKPNLQICWVRIFARNCEPPSYGGNPHSIVGLFSCPSHTSPKKTLARSLYVVNLVVGANLSTVNLSFGDC